LKKEEILKTKFDEKYIYTYGLPSLKDLVNLRSRFNEEKTDIMTNMAAIVFFRLFLYHVLAAR